MNNVDQKAVNAIRVLSADAIQKANSGHPGLPLGAAPMAYELWAHHMKHNPADPNWVNRDRFILSGGHGSALLYSLLHLFGYGLTKEDLMNFRQMGSKTPGHPEYGHTIGVEATTGPLGAGMGMAVGMAVGVIAVISLLLVGILVITGGGDKSEKIIVPDLIGRNIDEVMADPDITDNFTVKEATERQESDRPVGEILEQDPDGDGRKKATKGTIITVTVSSGGENVKDTYKVIDFTGKTLDYVQAALASHDIKCEVVEEYSDDVEEGKVIRTDPEAGAELEKGATLTVYISKGKQKDDNENVAVPGLLGMTKDDAEKALTEKGLSIGSVNEVESTAEAGSVVWQSQDAGAEVAKGTVVNIQISKGKSTSNNNSPDNNSGGNSGGQDNGDGDYDDTPSLGSATIPVSLPDNTDTAHVIIYVDGVIQYDDTCSTSGGSTSISVSGSVGDHDVTVSVDYLADVHIQLKNGGIKFDRRDHSEGHRRFLLCGYRRGSH